MNKEIKERIETINKGKVPDGYKKEKWQLFPEDWCKPSLLNTVLIENKERNENLVYGIDDVLSVSGEFGVVNQVDLLGRSYAGESVAPYHTVYTDDIVYTKSPLKQNPHGIIKMNKGKPGIVSTLYAVYHCINPITAQYIETYFSIDSYLNNYLKPLVKRGAKNDMKVNNEDVLKGVIPLPPLEEQEKIAEILSRCDTVIEECEKQVEEYKNLKKTCLSKMFPKKGSNVPEIRFPGFTDAWEQRKVTELGEIYIGLVTTMTSHYTDHGALLIRNSDIKDGRFAFGDNLIYLDDEFAKQNASRKHRVGDVITVHTGDIGTSAVITEKEAGSIGFATIVTRPDKEKITSEYLCTYLNTDTHKNFAMNISTGDGRNNYNLKDYYECVVPVPSIAEQNKISSLISGLNNLITLHQRKVEAYTQMKKALTQLLLTGIVRVNKQQEISY